MKILLVTLHSQNNNFGSVLQAHSLTQFLNENGYDVEILDYRPYYSNGGLNPLSMLKKICTNVMFFPFFIRRKRNFDSVVNLQKMTKRYTSIKEINRDVLSYDLYMIGSDQVWNTKYLCGKDPVYYLDFTDSEKKMSYAASLGSYIEKESILMELKRRIEHFKYVSFREKVSAIQMKQVGMENAEYVLDPVFLHNVDYYRKMQKTPKRKGYIFTYIIHKDNLIRQVINHVKELTGKDVVELGGFQSKCDSDYYPRTAGPKEFLGYMDNADIVITSSFHGLAFAHIYNKQFIVVMPNDNQLRLENILETAGTEDRVVKSVEDVDNLLKNPINYTGVNERIEKMRNSSVHYLLDSLDRLQ